MVVWIMHWAEESVIVGNSISKFMQICFSDNNSTGVYQLLDNVGIISGLIIDQCGRPSCSNVIFGINVVFHSEWQTM